MSYVVFVVSWLGAKEKSLSEVKCGLDSVYIHLICSNETLENNEKAIKNGQSGKTGNIEYTRKTITKTQHNMCWTPLCANKHK